MEQIVRNAYAKINLGLDVLRRREDGYHEVKMIMQTIGLYDTLTFIKKAEPGIVLKIDREPRDYKVTVAFDKAGQKIMYASFAKLKRL